MKYCFFIYILTNHNNTSLYIGLTDNLIRRIRENKKEMNEKSFSSKYKCFKLVYFEEYKYINNAINREKQLKRWNRKKKEFLINNQNLNWDDLYKKINYFI